MLKLFLGLTYVFGGYTVAILLGSLIATLIDIPISFISIWEIMFILFISALIASKASMSEYKDDKQDDN